MTTREVVTDVPMGEAVERGIVDNETLGYFMVRSYQFLIQCGIRPDGIRFRQHRKDEMAHYAQDCWDAEVETSYGWIEIAGHADRSAFDLTKHSEKTGADLQAARPLKEPRIVKQINLIKNKDLGKIFKQDTQSVIEAVNAWKEEEKAKYMIDMLEKGEIQI